MLASDSFAMKGCHKYASGLLGPQCKNCDKAQCAIAGCVWKTKGIQGCKDYLGLVPGAEPEPTDDGNFHKPYGKNLNSRAD
jgi:hypothetical protein